MSTTSTASLPPVETGYGALYFGVVLSTSFYGIACMQTFFYYIHYQNDPTRTRIFVAALWALNTIHEALSVAAIYKYIMAGLQDPYSFLYLNPEFVMQSLFTTVVAVLAQGYFVYRIYVFSKKNVTAPSIWVLSAICQLATSIAYAGKALYSENGIRVVSLIILTGETFLTLSTICFSLTAVVDVLIAMFLTYLLIRERSPLCFARTSHLLQRLIVFAVNTGLWTAAFAVFTQILIHIFPTNALYMIPYLPICSLYCNTVVANLNARMYLSGRDRTSLVNMNAFMNSGLQFCESARATETSKSGTSAQPDNWKAHEMAKFSDVNQSTTLAESTSV